MILPSLRNKRTLIDSNRNAENVNIARQRSQEIAPLEAEHDNHFQEAQHELQATLLEDLHSGNKRDKPNTTVAFKSWGVLIIALIPMLGFALYGYLGSPQFVAQSFGKASSQPPLEIAQLLVLLEEKLAQNPENASGWELAATTYMKLGDYKKATVAYAELNKRVVGNADFLVAWADAEILTNGNIYIPAIKDRIDRALAINPQHINGLWIAGIGANSLGEYDAALIHLNTLLSLVTNEPQSTDKIKQLIERIDAKNNASHEVGKRADNTQQQTPNTSTANGKTIHVEVMLADDLADKILAQDLVQALVQADDVVFIIAKTEGTPVPLAVSKHRVKDLPIKITLTENMAMLPNITIASFDTITVTARVSKTGQPAQQAGDLVSDTVLIDEENRGNTVQLVIDRIAK